METSIPTIHFQVPSVFLASQRVNESPTNPSFSACSAFSDERCTSILSLALLSDLHGSLSQPSKRGGLKMSCLRWSTQLFDEYSKWLLTCLRSYSCWSTNCLTKQHYKTTRLLQYYRLTITSFQTNQQPKHGLTCPEKKKHSFKRARNV